ncbi:MULTISPECIES: fimbrial protein [Serratia]|uniref:Fimbrial protein n=1 Tax=Serratia marcescens TaxID=615 RepID=A0ABD5BLR2_SERMA|nr:fimbrial protein [Serratia marcescens]MDE5235364.1 fimbrial protein [Serratia marcescens]MDE5259023.1 fimbrial protein [Serratia marcescens]MDP8602674.1 fimbrial protein [Serratia marcescens]MDP8618270.1 fimbrial protein [Serratia marcescens]MDP8687374.1 fimbrial protein [Serratia marcescens]
MLGITRAAHWWSICMGLLLAGASGSALAADNMYFHGALVAEPCTLRPGDEDIRLDFGSVIDKYLYTYGRTPGKAFNLVLQDCDLSLGKTVKVTFTGAESAALPGLLLPDGGSPLGIALGIETMAGSPVALNKPSQGYALANGSNSLQLQVYIQGEPAAIAQKSIGLGVFSSVATFALEYE